MSIPKAAVRSATVQIAPGLGMRVHVLDNGERVIEAEDVERFFEFLAEGGALTDEIALRLAKVVKGV